MNHREINKKINLYSIYKDIPGMIFWNNNGNILFNKLKEYIRYKIIYNKNIYEVKTPIIMEKFMWDKTGHTEMYYKNIYSLNINNIKYYIKPMNCPGHVKIFKNKIKSYKDLPYKIFEFGKCYRNERSGSLYGLMRTRNFTQDDTHIFCTIEQIECEIIKSINIIYNIYNDFKFKNINVILSNRPLKKIGNNYEWDILEKILFNILNNLNINFKINKNSGAFYGPKIEFLISDSSNKFWQCGTIQLDFFISKNLNIYYIDNKNIKKNPIVIHRAILGSIERFIGIITEHYNGKYPFWLSPIQILIVSISIKYNNYANKIFNILDKFNFRIKLNIENSTLNFKIKNYINNNIPYLIICGNNEVKNNTISVRNFINNNTNIMNINEFIKTIKKENNFCDLFD